MDVKGEVLIQLFNKSKLRNRTKTFLEPNFSLLIVKFKKLGFSAPSTLAMPILYWDYVYELTTACHLVINNRPTGSGRWKVLGVKARQMNNCCSSHKYRSRWGPVGRRCNFQCKQLHLTKELLKKSAVNLNRMMYFLGVIPWLGIKQLTL